MVFASLSKMVDVVLDPLLFPLLKLGPFWAIVIISSVVGLLTTLVYKWVTNQERMKELRERTRTLQKEIKRVSKEDPKKAFELQKKLFSMSKEQMMSSFKPMIITLLPLLIIFGWLNSHMAYEPILAGTEFTTTVAFEKNVNGSVTINAPQLEVPDEKTKLIEEGMVRWRLKGNAGSYDIEYIFMGKTYGKEVIIKEKGKNGYATPVLAVRDGLVETVSIDMKKIEILSIFGWKMGWLGTYIIFSLIFSFGLRKALKVH